VALSLFCYSTILIRQFALGLQRYFGQRLNRVLYRSWNSSLNTASLLMLIFRAALPSGLFATPVSNSERPRRARHQNNEYRAVHLVQDSALRRAVINAVIHLGDAYRTENSWLLERMLASQEGLCRIAVRNLGPPGSWVVIIPVCVYGRIADTWRSYTNVMQKPLQSSMAQAVPCCAHSYPSGIVGNGIRNAWLFSKVKSYPC
jgi:acyl-CoA synthetase (AMP-forming)/AMP-acid ligase II